MLYIRTIEDFQRLAAPQQLEILKALRTKERLDKWLWSLNDKPEHPVPQDESRISGDWQRCPHCLNHPGWIPLPEERDNSNIHPSQVGKCLRALWYACNGFAEEKRERVNPKLRLIFDIGHEWHHILQACGNSRETLGSVIDIQIGRRVKNYGLHGAWGDCGYTPEVPIEPDDMNEDGTPKQPRAHQYRIQGHADAVLEKYFLPMVPLVGDVTIRVGHEYKSIKSDGFDKVVLKPKFEHRQQATLYAFVLDVPVFVYLYVNKDTAETADFPMAFEQDLWNEMYRDKIYPVLEHTSRGTPPDWPLTSASKRPSECRECPYRTTICNPPIASR